MVLIQNDIGYSLRNDGQKLKDHISRDDNQTSISEIMNPLCIGTMPGPITILVNEELMDIIYPPKKMKELEEVTDIDGVDKLNGLKNFTAAGVCFQIEKHLLPDIKEKFPNIDWIEGSKLVALCIERIINIANTYGSANIDVGKNIKNAVWVVWMHELIHWYRGGTSFSHRFKQSEEAVVQITLWSLLSRYEHALSLRTLMINLASKQPECYRTF